MMLHKITDEGNAYGCDTIEILVFNYNGQGDALVRCDGDLGSMHRNDLALVLFGDPVTGTRWYEFRG